MQKLCCIIILTLEGLKIPKWREEDCSDAGGARLTLHAAATDVHSEARSDGRNDTDMWGIKFHTTQVTAGPKKAQISSDKKKCGEFMDLRWERHSSARRPAVALRNTVKVIHWLCRDLKPSDQKLKFKFWALSPDCFGWTVSEPCAVSC